MKKLMFFGCKGALGTVIRKRGLNMCISVILVLRSVIWYSDLLIGEYMSVAALMRVILEVFLYIFS